RFENAWRQGQRPRIGDYLAEIDGDRQALLIELVHEDLEQRLQAGEGVRGEGYWGGYSGLAASPLVGVDLIAAEFVLRERFGAAPRLEDYQARFPELAAILPQRVADRRDRADAQAQPRCDGQTVAPGMEVAAAGALPPAARSDSAAVSR